MKENALEDFRMFPGITESWELVQTGLVVIDGESHRLELWHCHSNPDIPYFVSVYVEQDGVWRKKAASPNFPIAPSAEEAMRTAMAFLSEEKAA
jgi:hypothetical protein